MNNNVLKSQIRGRLADATKEVTTTFGSKTGGWGGTYRYMPDSSDYGGSWFIRGGDAIYSSIFGVLLSSYDNGYLRSNIGSRPVLSISREFPWLSE